MTRMLLLVVGLVGLVGCDDGSWVQDPPDGGIDGAIGVDANVPSDGEVAADAPIDGPQVDPIQPSCDGLPATCGENGNASCCAREVVPGATYYRGSDAATPSTMFPATVRSFQLDTFEVSVGRFRAFVEAGQAVQAVAPSAGAGAHPWISNSGWRTIWNSELAPNRAALESALACSSNATWTATAGAHEQHPINCVNWFEAMAFCAWDGGFLPTEAEWNLAATGGTEQRVYPWSTPPSSTTISLDHANYATQSAITGEMRCFADGDPGCTIADILQVGTRPAGRGRWGHDDLAGNVTEWSLDILDDYEVPCTDCGGTPSHITGGYRMLRGGSYHDEVSRALTRSRTTFEDVGRADDIGFRCARPLSP